MAEIPFDDRRAAGRALAEALVDQVEVDDDMLILALPRGGVPVAYEVACTLRAPLDVLVVRKLGVPGNEEFAFGALAAGGRCILNHEVVELVGLDSESIDAIVARERRELARREAIYRGKQPFPEVAGRSLILIDDGLATGSTMRAAVAALRSAGPSRIIVAVPVAPSDVCTRFAEEVDQLVCLAMPSDFGGVGRWYRDFSQTSDEEVRDLLARAAAARERSGVSNQSPDH